MFKINSYLQYKNTPNGKPRVLVEGVDYKYIDEQALYPTWRHLDDGTGIAKSDCRPLLTVINIMSECWTEGDIAIYKGNIKIIFMIEESGIYKMVGRKSHELWNDQDESFFCSCEKLGSFFNDPAKYSKLLWNCSEEEGWEKVFELLEIKFK